MTNNKANNLKNFIPWIIVGVLIIGFDVIKIWPLTQDWLDLRDLAQKSKADIHLENTLITKLDQELQDIKTKFEYESKSYVLAETQIYPEKFDSYKVSKIIELYSYLYSLISDNSTLRVERITFTGQGKKSPDAQNTKEHVRIEIKSSEETLKDFIKFIQTGTLPEQLLNNIGNKDFGVSEMEFILRNKLPIAHIDSIQTSEKKESASNAKTTALDITFFTQK